MNSQEIAENFVRFFCSANMTGLESILADDFQLQGPLLNTASRSDYLASLSDNLTPDPEAKILAAFGKGDKAAVFYSYRGNTVAQLFFCKAGRVNKTILVFDTKILVNKSF